MDNLYISVGVSGLVPPACDAEAGQGECIRSIGDVYSPPGSDSWSDPQSGMAVADPLVKHGLLEKFRMAIAELCCAIRGALDDEHVTAEDSLQRAAELLRDMESIAAPAQAQSRGGLAPWQVRKVTSYIEANLDQTIRNEDLAALARLNASHFGRVFRNSFGEPPHEYVIRRRVERAQGLMLSTTAPLSSIALDCGLADQAHLSRLFRRVVGETPRAWRRARLGEPAGAN